MSEYSRVDGLVDNGDLLFVSCAMAGVGADKMGEDSSPLPISLRDDDVLEQISVPAGGREIVAVADCARPRGVDSVTMNLCPGGSVREDNHDDASLRRTTFSR